jgi:ribosomal protein S12 methylthiotransferase accessory factor
MELSERFQFFLFCAQPANFFSARFSDITDDRLPFDMIAASVHDTSGDLESARRLFETLPLQWTRAFNLTTGKTPAHPLFLVLRHQ